MKLLLGQAHNHAWQEYGHDKPWAHIVALGTVHTRLHYVFLVIVLVMLIAMVLSKAMVPSLSPHVASPAPTTLMQPVHYDFPNANAALHAPLEKGSGSKPESCQWHQ